MHDHLQQILRALAGGGVDFIVAGGVAAVLNGVERLTMDIDMALEMSGGNVRRFLAVMREQGLQPRAPVSADSLLDPELVRAMVEQKGALVFTFHDPALPLRQVDVFLTEDNSYGALLPDTWRISLGEDSIRVVSARRLIAIKRAVRPVRAKDQQDIEVLERLLAGGGEAER